MPSTAISAQGSIVQIATGSGGAKTITGVAVGNPTILTSAAHGFSNGDVVTFAALTGADAALLNGQTLVVRDKTHHRQDNHRRFGHRDAGRLHADQQHQELFGVRWPGQRTRQDEHVVDSEGVSAQIS